MDLAGRKPPVSAPPAPVAVQGEGSSRVQQAGVYIFCLYVLGVQANDLALQYVGSKAYVSMIMGPLVLLLFLVSGDMWRGLRSRTGQFWLLLMFWIVGATLFSTYRQGSLDFIINYIPRLQIMLFVVSAFTVTLLQCRTMVNLHTLIGVLVLIFCMVRGEAGADGRMGIPGSYLYSNTNDLALALVIAFSFFLYGFLQNSVPKAVVSMFLLVGGLLFLLKTGSRGSFLAFAILILITLMLSQNRSRLLLLVIPAMALVVVSPTQTLHRLALMFNPGRLVNSVADEQQIGSDIATVGSQNERWDLLKKAVRVTLEHPLVGVGPDQFVNYLWESEKKKGIHYPALGTHNSYTQIASECGIPALILFVGTLFTAIRTNYRIYRASAALPQMEAISSIAFCLFSVLVAFAVNAFFHHVAYSGTLPLVAGLTISFELAAMPLLQAKRENAA